MTVTFLSAIVSAVHPLGARLLIPSYRDSGEMDLTPPPYGYRTLYTAALACAAVSICGNTMPAAPVKVSVNDSFFGVSRVVLVLTSIQGVSQQVRVGAWDANNGNSPAFA